VRRNQATEADALNLGKTVICPDRYKLQRLIKGGRYLICLKILNYKAHQRTLSNKQVASATLPAPRAAAHVPIWAANGYCVNKHFGGAIVNNEGNDGFSASGDGAYARGDFIADDCPCATWLSTWRCANEKSP
jgi:hypothetical protein